MKNTIATPIMQFRCQNVTKIIVKKRYIGETNREVKERIKEHIGYAKNNKTLYATGEHFNLPGHTYQNMKFTIVEKVKKQDIIYRQEREKYFIQKFNTFYDGINKMP